MMQLMEKEIKFIDLSSDEMKTIYALENAIILKSQYLSYGYADDCICISKTNNEWLTYFVDKGEVFNIRKFPNVYLASMQIIEEISENKEEQKKRLKIFADTISEIDKQIENCTNQSEILKKIIKKEGI